MRGSGDHREGPDWLLASLLIPRVDSRPQLANNNGSEHRGNLLHLIIYRVLISIGLNQFYPLAPSMEGIVFTFSWKNILE